VSRLKESNTAGKRKKSKRKSRREIRKKALLAGLEKRVTGGREHDLQ